MLRAESADFFCFYPSLVTFWGTLVPNDTKIVHFTFYVYFTRGTEATMFLRAMMGPPLDTPLSGAGAQRVRKLDER